jgi:hypothetical protein
MHVAAEIMLMIADNYSGFVGRLKCVISEGNTLQIMYYAERFPCNLCSYNMHVSF